MFEQFTERARRVIILAREEAGRSGHNHVGTEHLLFGILQDGEGVATVVLQRFGLQLKTVQAEVKRALAKLPKTPAYSEVPFTPRDKRVLELSIEESRQLRHNYIGTSRTHPGPMSGSRMECPVTLPPGWERLDTSPSRTGSAATVMTIGIVLVACMSARAASNTPRTHCLLFTVLPKKSNTTDTPMRSSSMARGSIRLRHFAEAFAKSASDWISKPSRQIHASSQNTTAGSVRPSSRASVVLPAPALPPMK